VARKTVIYYLLAQFVKMLAIQKGFCINVSDGKELKGISGTTTP